MLKKILELGIMLEPDALEFLKDEKRAALVFEKLGRMKEKPLVLKKREAEEMCMQITIAKELKNPTHYSVHDMVGLYAQRYKELQALLMNKIELKNPVSIRNAKGHSAVIGMKGGNMIEDPTGSMGLVTDIKLLDDDVVGAVGRVNNNTLYAEKIVFPDTGLRSPARFPMKITTGKHILVEGTRFYECCGVLVLVHVADHKKAAKELGINEKDVPLELLKRRHLNKPPNDVIDPVPDIFITTTTEHFTKNYKGTTIIGLPKHRVVEIDLETRDIRDIPKTV